MIKIQDEIPNTHFFVYRNQRFPFNFDLFKYSSRYLSNNQVELEKSEFIELLENGETIPNMHKENR